jgi:hypothetical protein
MVNPNRFYTYAYLREDRTPYYIGKGSGYRINSNTGRPCNKPRDKSRIIFLKQNLTEEEAFKHEIYMIDVFGRIDLGTGILYNKTNGGEGASGYKYTEERKEKCRGENSPFYGKTHSKEAKERMGESKLGNKNPAKRLDVREKIKKNHPFVKNPKLPKIIGEKLRGRKNPKHSENMKGEKNHMFGKKRPKHSENMKGKNNPNYCKGSFYEVISPGGEIGYTCILENFCKHNNLDRGSIGKVINNQARHHKGWTVFKLN